MAFAEQSYKYSDDICDSDKCIARVERLNECYTERSDNVVECAVKLTIREVESILMTDLLQLEERARREAIKTVENTWKEKAVSLAVKHEKFSASAYCDKLEPFIKAN